MTARVHGQPVNWQEADGTWRPIESTLGRNSDGRIRPSSVPFDVSFAEKVGAGELLTIRGPGWSASLSPAFAVDKAKAETNGPAVWYRSVQPGLDIGYIVLGDQVKEMIRLTGPAAGDDGRWRFHLKTKGVKAETEGDGSIGLHDKDGKLVATLPVGRAFDSAGGDSNGPATAPVALRLVGGGRDRAVEVSVDKGWLSDPARVYPVIVDPEIVFNAGRESGHWDAHVGSGCLDCNYNGNGQIDGWVNNGTTPIFTDKIGKSVYNGGTWEWYSYLTYELPRLPGNHQVLSGRWHGYFWDAAPRPNQFSMWPVTQPWSDNTVTWRNKPNHSADRVAGEVTATGQWVNRDITSWVANWSSGAWPNHGISMDTGGRDNYFRLAANESNFMGTDSYLEIHYENTRAEWPSQADLRPVPGATSMTTSPTLSTVAMGDVNGDPVRYWFRVTTSPDADGGQVVNSGWTSSPSFTVPPGSLQDGVTYYWKVFTWDGIGDPAPNNSSWPPNKLKINLRLGDQAVSPYDAAGPAKVNLANGNVSYQTSSPSFSTVGGPVGLTYTYNSGAQSPFGLRGEYWNNCGAPSPGLPPAVDRRFGDPVLVRTDPNIDFSWGDGSPAPGIINADDFCIRWKGFITVPRANTYMFQGVRDDGMRIFVDGQPAVDSWFDQATNTPLWGQEKSVGVFTNRTVPIEVQYYEHGGGAHAQLWVAGPNVDPQIVPSSWLSPTPAALPQGWSVSVGTDAALAYNEARVTSSGSVVLVDPSGGTHEFQAAGGGWTPPPGEEAMLTRSAELDGSPTYVVETAGMSYVFNSTGKLIRAVSGTDDTKPAASQYFYDGGDTGRLAAVGDPVSGRRMTLTYSAPNGTDNGCPGAPSGFSAAPTGMLCAVGYWDGTATQLYYTQTGQLGRISDPGGVQTDFGYSGSLLTALRTPLANDAIRAGVRAQDGGAQVSIGYDGGRATSVTLPAPTPGAPRPQRSYGYGSGTTDVHIAGMAEPNGYARRVTYDDAGRVLGDYDTAGLGTTHTWNAADQPLSTRDPAGRLTTTIYDYAERPVDSYGPGPEGCFGPDRRPNGSCTDPPVAHSATAYDADWGGLAAAYWSNPALAGPATSHGTGLDNANWWFDRGWGGGSPPGLPADNWSARFTGDIVLPLGIQNIALGSDDGSRLWIDDRLVVDFWTDHAFGMKWAPVPVVGDGGRHRIRIEYYERGGAAGLQLWWSHQGTHYVVDNRFLFPRYGLVTSTTAEDVTAGSPSQVVATTYARPETGLATTVTQDPGGLGLSTKTTYEDPGSGYFRRTGRQLPAGNAWGYGYWGAGETTAHPCGAGGLGSQAGLVRTATGPDPDGTGPGVPLVEESRYDAAGRVVASRTAAAWTCMTYDSRGRIVTKVVPAGGGQPARTVTYNNSVGGNPLVTSVSDQAGTVTTESDLLGRVIGYTDVWNNRTVSQYDQAGRLADTTGPAGAWHTDYDPATGRVANQRLDGGIVAQAGYDAAGELVKATYPSGSGFRGNGTAGVISRDRYGQAQGVDWTRANGVVLATDVVTRSQTGRIVDETVNGVDASPGPNFTYDAVGRLTAGRVPNHSLTYAFSPSGGCGAMASAGANTNRTSVIDNGVSTTYCYDGADKLTSTSDIRFTNPRYDTHGNTVNLGLQTLTYDGAERHVATKQGTRSVTYTRDATDRIVARQVPGTSIALRGKQSSSNGAGGPALVLAKPPNLTTGDLVVAQVVVRGGTTTSSSTTTTKPTTTTSSSTTTTKPTTTTTTTRPTTTTSSSTTTTLPTAAEITAPPGWTLVDVTAQGTDVRQAVYWHVAGTNEPASWSWSFDSARQAAGGVLAYSGVDTSAPVNASAKGTNATGTTHPVPSATTTTPYAQVLTVLGFGGGTASAPATGSTERWDVASTGTTTVSQASAEAADRVVPGAGVVASGAVTSTTAAPSVVQVLALKPAATVVATRYGYSGDGDSADMTLDGAGRVVERVATLLGGAVLTTRSGGDVWSYTNIHGDVVATANKTGGRTGSYAYDPFGQRLGAVPDNLTGNGDYGWLGGKGRFLDPQFGFDLIEMGARPYIPGIGRFLAVDPVEGGCANDYAYVSDPMNQFDLDGNKCPGAIQSTAGFLGYGSWVRGTRDIAAAAGEWSVNGFSPEAQSKARSGASEFIGIYGEKKVKGSVGYAAKSGLHNRGWPRQVVKAARVGVKVGAKLAVPVALGATAVDGLCQYQPPRRASSPYPPPAWELRRQAGG